MLSAYRLTPVCNHGPWTSEVSEGGPTFKMHRPHPRVFAELGLGQGCRHNVHIPPWNLTQGQEPPRIPVHRRRPGLLQRAVFTFKLCRAVCKRLAVRLQNDGCAFPPITEQWLKDQALRCLKHCRSAKKLPPKKVTMDVADTLPMPECAQPARNSDP